MLDTELYLIAFTFVIAALIVFLVALISAKSWPKNENDGSEAEENGGHEESAANASSNGRIIRSASNGKSGGNRNRDFKAKGDKMQTYTHSWLASNLKGHTGKVLDMDFSSNGKHLVSSSEDRTLLVWNTKDFLEREHKCVRGNVELDHAKLVRFAPDSKSLILVLAYANKLAVYKLAKKEEGSSNLKIQPVEGIEFPEKHQQEVSCVGISCNGKFIMTAANDTTLIIWSLRGDVLKVLDTKQSTIHHAAVSPCGRFVASSGFTPDVPVWEVKFTKSGDFQEVSRAFELKGHSSGVVSFDFNQDSTKMITASKDGTWRLWDTDIRYQHGQDPVLLRIGELDILKLTSPSHVQVALAPNGDSFAIASLNSLRIYRWLVQSQHDDPDGVMEDVHQEAIGGIRFSGDSKCLVSFGDRHIRVFHNLSYYKAVATNTLLLIKDAKGEAHKQRLIEQAREARSFLRQILGDK